MRNLFYCVAAGAALITLSIHPIQAQKLSKSPAYNFRESDAFRALDQPTRERLLKVVHDLAILEKVLNTFMDDHGGSPPKSLHDLVPKYLKSLPVDPFATEGAAVPDVLKHFERSLNGRGYLYNQRSIAHSIKSYVPLERRPVPYTWDIRSGAWDIRSVGLRDFPLRNRDVNPGLIRSRGVWGPWQLDVF